MGHIDQIRRFQFSDWISRQGRFIYELQGSGNSGKQFLLITDPLRVRHTDDSAHLDGRVLVLHLFHHQGKHFVATDADHILGPVHNVEVSVLIQLTHITGIKPPGTFILPYLIG